MPTMYWKRLEERAPADTASRPVAAEFADEAARDPSRRDFLRLAGFGAAAVGASCSRAPVRQAIPLVSPAPGLAPGTSASYATTCTGCAAGCGLLVTCRDGRPIKVEGMPEHPLSAGGVCAVGQASLLGLYDHRRYRHPLVDGRAVTWDEADTTLRDRFEEIRRTGGAVRVLTSTVTSPTVRQEIQAFLETFGDGAHVEYDACSAAAVLDAHARTHGRRVLPRYRFDRADVVVGIEADFLGTWIAPVEFMGGYARRRRRRAEDGAPWHAQVESLVTITGGKADRRLAVGPDEIAAFVDELAESVETGAAAAGPVADLAVRLLAARGRSLVICGLQDVRVQARCNAINAVLGNYGATLDLDRPSSQRRGDDRHLARLLEDAAAGRLAAVVVWRANPLFDLPAASSLATVPVVVSAAERADETSAAAHVVCPDHHPFETWGDAEPVAGVAGLVQPLVTPLGGTRAFVETLAAWRGAPRPAVEIVRDRWRAASLARQPDIDDFERFWPRAVQAGFVTFDPPPTPATGPASEEAPLPAPAAVAPGATALVLYQGVAVPGGEHAYNPLLQELPDPVSKITWDNYAAMAPALAARLGVATGDVVRLETATGAVEVPALVQPGQHERTVAVALGYGGLATERFRDLGRHWFQSRPTVGPDGRVGVNAAPLLQWRDGLLARHLDEVRVVPTGRVHPLACTQDHHSLVVPERLRVAGADPRPIVQEVSIDARPSPAEPASHPVANLWPDDHPKAGHWWAMSVDLDACTGCGACVVACQVENNVPVVGKDEVRRNREMHWLRIDRYFAEDEDGLRMAHQPMFCQHCDHAPCETVCPTLATVHSAEGLNQQVYNRCVGTRYCANNCPFKARRFNWFAYGHGEDTETLRLNPAVTVRSRGVMEKCTMCVHRIQEKKIDAKARGVPLEDGVVQTACQQSCPARAIVFGDINDASSEVSRLASGDRGYVLLEELNVRPSVTYLKIVRHAVAGPQGDAHHG